MKYNQTNNLKRIHKGWIMIPLALLSVCVGSAIHNNNVHASNRNPIESGNPQNTKQSLDQPSLVNNHLASKSGNEITSQMISKRANGLETGIINRAVTQVKSANYNNTQKSHRSNLQNRNSSRSLGQNANTSNDNVKYGQGTVTVPIYEKSQGQKRLTNNVTITVREPIGSTTDLWTLFSGKNPVYTYSGHSLRSANGSVIVDKQGRVSLSPNAGVTYVGNSNGLDSLIVKVPINNTNRDFITLQLPDDVEVGSTISLTNDMIRSNPGNRYSIRGKVPIYYSDGPNDIVHKIQEYGSIIDNSKGSSSSSSTRNSSSNAADINSSKASLPSTTNVPSSVSNNSSIANNSTNVSNSNPSIISQGSTPSVTDNSLTVDSNVSNNSQNPSRSLFTNASPDDDSTNSGTSNAPAQSPLSVTNNPSTASSNVRHNNSNEDNNVAISSSKPSMNNDVRQSDPSTSEANSALNSATDNRPAPSQSPSNSTVGASLTNMSIKSQGSAISNDNQNITHVNSSSVNKSNELPQTGDSNYYHSILNASTLLMLSTMLFGLAADIDKHRLN